MRSKSLRDTHPALADEASGWDPSGISFGSNKKVRWKCKKGHEWDAIVANRARRSDGCPYCSNRRALSGYNDLATTHPELANQVVGSDPTEVTQGSGKYLRWKCSCVNEWEASVKGRTDGNNCPMCSGRIVRIGFNDLATTHPELSKEAFGWDPTKVSTRSGIKMRWKCASGHVWFASPDSRAGSGNGCFQCRHSGLVVGVNDLATTHSHLASQATDWDPTQFTRSSNNILSWRCENGHETRNSPRDRVLLKKHCSVCSGRQLLAGFNDFRTTHPELAKQVIDRDPKTFTYGSGAPIRWKCTLGHEWRTQASHRVNGRNCPTCANQRILTGYNDLATTHPEIARQAFGWDPTTVVAGSERKYRWKCDEGHEWVARSLSRTSQGTGCPRCALTGFDQTQKAWLYFLSHPIWELFQIGITNYPEDRLKRHTRLGWELVNLRGPMDGLLTRRWETSVLQMLKREGAVFASADIAGKFDGYSESWTQNSFEASSLDELMMMVLETESESAK